MLDHPHSLMLNEAALEKLPEQKRPVFIFEWLRYLDKALGTAQTCDIRECQKTLVKQLMERIQEQPGPSTRKLIARCLATLFSVGDTFLLFETVNKCNDIIKTRNESEAFQATRIAAICCIGHMYKKLGRMMGRSYEETIVILIRSLKSVNSQTRVEIIQTLEKVCAGMGNAICNLHKEIYKACRNTLVDRVMVVRSATAHCLQELLKETTFLHTTELESLATLCFRAFDGSNYEARLSIAKLLGALVALTQQHNMKLHQQQVKLSAIVAAGGSTATVVQQQQLQNKQLQKCVSLDEALNVLQGGFLRGGVGFLKGTGEIIKGGSSNVNREVRLGVTHAYVVFVQILGGPWLEKNMSVFLQHILELVANPKASSTHVDAVYSRRCINFILRNSLGKLLGEKAQTSACKDIVAIVAKHMKSLDFSAENTRDINADAQFNQHLLTCALIELGRLIYYLGSSTQILLTDTSLKMLDVIFSVLVHPCVAARLAAAWCIRCLCTSLPTEITPLIDRCLTEGIETLRTSPEAISGYSSALAAILSTVRYSPLGVPHMKGKIIFNTAEELLRTANQNSRLSLYRTEAGWLLIGAICTLGPAVIRGLLPRMLLLWRNSFPRSESELNSEKSRGDSFTWHVALVGRAGALSAVRSLLLHCGSIVNEEVRRRLLGPIECCTVMLMGIAPVLKQHGQVLKAPAAMVRLRLYETLALFPAKSYSGSYKDLLRLLVSEFTLMQNQANTTNSLLRNFCHVEDSVILGICLQENDHASIEEQLNCNSAAGSGALEHDLCCLYLEVPSTELTVPGPLPLGVAVIDKSIEVFGVLFCRVANNKHRMQMLTHFLECIRQAKATRQEAIQLNIFAAILNGLKHFAEVKSEFGSEDVRKSAVTLITGGLASPNLLLRCAAGECLGRLSQVVGDPRFILDIAQMCFEKLQLARDALTRTGHSHALGCLHSYVGGMSSGQLLNKSVSILMALAGDCTSTVVQVWSLHALALVSDSVGPLYRDYVESTVSLILKLMLNVQQSNVDIYQCIGKVLASLITTIGPELQDISSMITSARESFLSACAIMLDHPDPLIQAEATSCLQQLHLFAPKYVNLSSLVPTLCHNLSSNHLLLRKAALSCLRQLVQREAREVCDLAMLLAHESCENVEGLTITETGLPGALFNILNNETNAQAIDYIHEIISTMLQVTAADNVAQWLRICREVLTISTEETIAVGEDSVAVKDDNGNNTDGQERGDDDDDDLADINLQNRDGNENTYLMLIQPRWPTRVFAAKCVNRVIDACLAESNRSPSRPTYAAHFDLVKARSLKNAKNDFLVLHLSNLIRMAFIAATSDSHPLRKEGLSLLRSIIHNFSHVPEPEFPGHLLLEQYQAQVSAALRPAFAVDTPAYITAAACEVCSTWISSGVARNLNDLRRVHQLLVSSLSKLEQKSGGGSDTGATQLMHNESLQTLLILAILKAWAHVYIVAVTKLNGMRDDGRESLLTLVQPQLEYLSKNWFLALKDYALLTLPTEFSTQLPREGGAFYINETAQASKPYYDEFWPSILHAMTLFLVQNDHKNVPSSVDDEKTSENKIKFTESDRDDKFSLIYGICIQNLSMSSNNSQMPAIDAAKHASQVLETLLSAREYQHVIFENDEYAIEMCQLLLKIHFTSNNLDIQLNTVKIFKYFILTARRNNYQENSLTNEKSLIRLIFMTLSFILLRYYPSLNANLSATLGATRTSIMPAEDANVACVLGSVFQIIESLLPHTTGHASLKLTRSALAVILDITKLYALHGNASYNEKKNTTIEALLQCLKAIIIFCKERGKQTEDVCNNNQISETIDGDTTGDNANTDVGVHVDETVWFDDLRISLNKTINIIKQSSDDTKVSDNSIIMVVFGLFTIHGPSEVLYSAEFLYPCINFLNQCFQSDDVMLKQRSISTFKSILIYSPIIIRHHYIKMLGPIIIKHLYTSSVTDLTDTDCTTLTEIVDTIELILELCEPKIMYDLFTLVVVLLTNFLLDNDMRYVANKNRQHMHDVCLKWLTKCIPKHPEHFKRLIGQSAELRLKIESAIRNEAQTEKSVVNNNGNRGGASKSAHVQQPSIKLKTDFSNFS